MIWQLIDFYRLVDIFIAPYLRKPTTLSLLHSVARPMDLIYTDTLYKMQHNSQVIYLEKMLNEWFQVSGYDPMQHEATKTVYISNAPRNPKRYIYQPSENQPIYLGSIYLSNEPPATYKFIVNVPTAYTFDELLLRAVIDFYRLAGKQYLIQTYEL